MKALQTDMKRKLLIFIIGLLVLMLVLPWLIPTQTILAQLEQAATDKLGVPVKVKSLSLALLPTPRAHLAGIHIGNQDEITVEKTTLVLDITTLMAETRVISRVELDKPVVKKSVLPLVELMLSQKSQGPAPVVVRQINLHGARLVWGGVNVPEFNAGVLLGEANHLMLVKLNSVDGKMHIEVSPKAEGYSARFKAKEWIMPVGPALEFDLLEAEFEYDGQRIALSRIDAQLYRGQLQVSGGLDFRHEWKLNGQFKVRDIALGDATQLFTKTVKVSGRISGDGVFSGKAKTATALADNLALGFKFNVSDGVLYGMDLAKAATLLVKLGTNGGETRFDKFSGVLKTRGKAIDLSHIKVASGLLGATGSIKVTPEKRLAGRVEVELKQSLSVVAVPLEISGTLDQPSVLPTKAALVGAAVGTGVLGPAGTALGVKAGSALEKLFGE